MAEYTILVSDIVLVPYRSKTDYDKINGLKQHKFIISCFVDETGFPRAEIKVLAVRCFWKL